ncbi:MAG: hypothetical protein WEB57_12390 [Pseudohongiellaceae bacterium]
MKQNRRDIELRFYPRTDVDFTLTYTAGETQRVIQSRNLSRKGIEVDLEQSDVDAIRAASPPDALFPRARLLFDQGAAPTPLDGMQLEAELFRLRRISQARYVGFFRFADPGEDVEAVIHEALKALQ